jgi:hypothetical protein
MCKLEVIQRILQGAHQFACPQDFRTTRLELTRVEREPGLNTTGMVAWLMTLKTPECPQGRQVGGGDEGKTIDRGRHWSLSAWLGPWLHVNIARQPFYMCPSLEHALVVVPRHF